MGSEANDVSGFDRHLRQQLSLDSGGMRHNIMPSDINFHTLHHNLSSLHIPLTCHEEPCTGILLGQGQFVNVLCMFMIFAS